MEYRKGNIVRDYLGNVVVITGFMDDIIYHTENPIGVTHGNKIEPILLNDYWFDELGFKTKTISFSNYGSRGGTMDFMVRENYGVAKSSSIFSDDIFWTFYYVFFNGASPYAINNVKYVHDLQNIYYEVKKEMIQKTLNK